MIPWYKMVRAASGVVAKKMGGKRVASDIAQSKAALHKEYAKTWQDDFETEHLKDLHDLVTKDSEVSVSWLNKMIENSKSPGELSDVIHYLRDSRRTTNLTGAEKGSLLSKASSKIDAIRDHALMERFMSFLKEHGDDLF